MDMTTLAVLLSGLQQIEEKIKVVEREGFKVQVEESKNILSGVGEEKIFYFIPKDTQTPKNGYDEYIYANSKWELVGSTDIDLNYELLSNKPQINGVELVGNKTSAQLGLQKELTAGENVTIDENGVISATGGVTDYNDLENKPQINGHALSGDKSASDLGLQDKLTAGTNINIDENNVISASGVTSYNDLIDKPKINNIELNGNKTTSQLNLDYKMLANIPMIKGKYWGVSADEHKLVSKLFFGTKDFKLESDIATGVINLNIDSTYFNIVEDTFDIVYDFNYIHQTFYDLGACRLRFKGAHKTTNFPTALSEIDRTKDYFIFQYTAGGLTTATIWIIRKVVGKTANDKYVEYAQMAAVTNPVYESQYRYYMKVVAETPWQKISGGSQIVSGVVNQDGTITLTDSDGNTFTTTGASIIGPQGDDYVLTEQDKMDIAGIVLDKLPTVQGVLYGNANN